MILKNWIKHQFRKKTRVYIMPTRMGGYVIGLLFLMFLLSIGYSNNLMLIFTIIFFAFNLMWLVEGHFHLNDLKLKSIEIRNGHAGELIPLKIHWAKSPEAPWRWRISIENEDQEFLASSINCNENEAISYFISPPRGPVSIKYLKVESDRPHGLYKTWIFFKAPCEFLSYPSLINVSKLDMSGLGGEGEVQTDKRGDDEFKSLSPYQGDEARKISWKHYARVGELVVKEGEEHQASIVRFKLMIPDDLKLKESYLSTLASEMVTCHHKLIPFSFEAGSFMKPPSIEQQHLNDCLTYLALC